MYKGVHFSIIILLMNTVLMFFASFLKQSTAFSDSNFLKIYIEKFILSEL